MNMAHYPIGKLYGIGIGPGDPDLITVKGLRILQQVPVVAFPTGSNQKPGLAQQTMLPWIKADQVQLALTFPYVQDETVLLQAWQVAADRVWTHLKQGQDVAFLCEGDIGFYSSFTYLAQTLLQNHPEVEIQSIPGISSPMAAAATLGIPLTYRAEKLVILPALYSVTDLETVLTFADVVVLMKVGSVYQQVWTILSQHNLLQRSYIVERATLPEQIIYRDLSDRPHLQLPYFSILIVQVTEEDAVPRQLLQDSLQ
jgi:precorrin-2/cobalt-factor-2 C20-methyltransferase